MARTVKIEFITTQFEFAHGRRPSGRGGWAFGLESNPRTEDIFFAPSGTYAEAKKAAREWVQKLADGTDFTETVLVYVLS